MFQKLPAGILSIIFALALNVNLIHADIVCADNFSGGKPIANATKVNPTNSLVAIGLSPYSDIDRSVSDISFGTQPGFHGVTLGTLEQAQGRSQITFTNLQNDPAEFLEKFALSNANNHLLDDERDLLSSVDESEIENAARLSNIDSNGKFFLTGFDGNRFDSTVPEIESTPAFNFAGYEAGSTLNSYRAKSRSTPPTAQKANEISNPVSEFLKKPSSLLVVFGTGIAFALRRRRK